MLEERTYKVQIVGSFTGESAEKKTPYIGLELETDCGNYIDWISYMTEKTAKRALKTLIDAGFKGKKLSDLSNDKLTMEDLFEPNSALTAVIEHEEWTNDEGEIKKKAKVKWLNTGGSSVEKADHKKSVQMFSGTSFDGMMKEMQKELPAKSKAKPAKESEENDEDIPF